MSRKALPIGHTLPRMSSALATRKSSAPRRLFHLGIDPHSAASRDDEVISAGGRTLAQRPALQ